MHPLKLKLLPALLGLGLAAGPAWSQGSDQERLESLRQTTIGLIESLVSSGIMTRERADVLLKQVREGTVGAAPSVQNAPRPPARPDTTVRVPYVPQVVRDQIRDEVKQEVVKQAAAERWGVPGMAPEWTERIKVEGDVRFRAQADKFGKDNPTPADFVTGALGTLSTRMPDLAAVTVSRSTAGTSFELPNANTQADRDRLRLRARLGLVAKIDPVVTAGIRLATGSATDRVSTNQTLGQNFNRYQMLLDRAYIRLDPAPWASVSAGRIANPWFSSGLTWSDNLSFEGLASSFKWPMADGRRIEPFATIGAFPIREQSPPRRGRWLFGVQAGFDWTPATGTFVKFGLAQYQYQNLEGRQDNDYLVDPANVNSYLPGATYGQYEYEAGLRQRGNTLFATNSPLDTSCLQGAAISGCKWGLLSKFKPIALTASVELGHFAPTWILLSGEYVRNRGFDAGEIANRLGTTTAQVQGLGGRRHGFNLLGTVGAREVRRAGDWQASLGYRWLGSDATLDAFTDSDYGLGGTNQKGYSMAFTYAIARNTTVGLRYLTAKTIDSPTVQPVKGDAFKVSNLQADLSARF